MTTSPKVSTGRAPVSVAFLGMIQDVDATMARWDLLAFVITIRELAADPPAPALSPGGEDEALARVMLSWIGDHGERIRISRGARERAAVEFSQATFAGRYHQLISPKGA